MPALGRTAVSLAVASAAVVAALSAHAAAPGGWTQIAHQHNGARPNLGLARGKDGTLHVLWAGPARAPFTSILDSPVSRSGAVGRPQPVLSGWAGVHPPTAVAAPDGAIHMVVSGSKTPSNSDPYSGLNEVVGPGAWKLGAHAYGSAPITEASNADVRVAMLKTGQLVSVWESAASMLMQTGVDPGTAPQKLTPSGASPVVAVDQRTGEAVIAYDEIDNGKDYFRRILPSLGAPQLFPSARLDAPQIAARLGGGVYTAYTPDGVRVWLLRFGGRPASVPTPKGVRVLSAGLAPGPEGRLWVFYGDEKSTYVTRTSKTVSGFEPVQKLTSPPNTVQYFRLEGEGSTGPLDLLADVTVDGKTKDGSYQRHVLPLLSLAVGKKAAKNKKGAVIGVRVSVRVLDAGDGVKGAVVAGLPIGRRKTDATGTVVFTVSTAKHGVFRLTASNAGYLPATGTLSL